MRALLLCCVATAALAGGVTDLEVQMARGQADAVADALPAWAAKVEALGLGDRALLGALQAYLMAQADDDERAASEASVVLDRCPAEEIGCRRARVWARAVVASVAESSVDRIAANRALVDEAAAHPDRSLRAWFRAIAAGNTAIAEADARSWTGALAHFDEARVAAESVPWAEVRGRLTLTAWLGVARVHEAQNASAEQIAALRSAEVVYDAQTSAEVRAQHGPGLYAALAGALGRAGDAPGAATVWRKVCPAARSWPVEDRVRACGSAYDEAAREALLAGNRGDAEAAWTDALAEVEALPPGDVRIATRAEVQAAKAMALEEVGDWAGSRDAWSALLSTAAAIQDAEQRAAIEVQGRARRAAAHGRLGDEAAMLADVDRAQDALDAMPDGEARDASGRFLDWELSRLATDREPDEAVARLRAVVATASELPWGTERYRQLAQANLQLGYQLLRVGRIEEALATYDAAFQAAHGPGLGDLGLEVAAKARNHQGLALRAIGRLEEAGKKLEEGLFNADRIQGQRTRVSLLVESNTNLALVQLELGRAGEAEARWLRAHELAGLLADPNATAEVRATIDVDLVDLYVKTGRGAEAVPVAARAVEEAAALTDDVPRRQLRAMAAVALAQAHLVAGDAAAALGELEAAFATTEDMVDLGQRTGMRLRIALLGLGGSSADKAGTKRFVGHMRLAAQESRDHCVRLAGDSRATCLRGLMWAAGSALAMDHVPIRDRVEFLLTAEEAVVAQAPREGPDHPCWRALAAASASAAHHPGWGLPLPEACAGRDLPADVTTALKVQTERLAWAGGDTGPTARPGAAWKAVRKLLRSRREVLLRYVTYGPDPVDESAPLELGVLRVDGGGASFHPLGGLAGVRDLAGGLRTVIAATQDGAPQYEPADWAAGAAGLRAELWDPFVAPGQAVVLVTDDVLTATPFVALPGRTAQFLVEEHAVRQLPLAVLLVPRPGGPPGDGLFALGDPDVERRSAGARRILGAPPTEGLPASLQVLRRVVARRLHFAKAEVEGLRASYTGAFGANPSVALGGEASEAAFRAQVGGKRFVHVSSHGFLWQQERARLPEVRAGLALTGFLVPGLDPVDDGLLTALEVRTLDLSGVQLVTLSACESGLGEAAASEVLGFQSAFFAAGAQGLLTTLWTVDDEETAAMMKAFYDDLWASAEPASVALRRAMLARIAALRARDGVAHPYYWAPFQAMTRD